MAAAPTVHTLSSIAVEYKSPRLPSPFESNPTEHTSVSYYTSPTPLNKRSKPPPPISYQPHLTTPQTMYLPLSQVLALLSQTPAFGAAAPLNPKTPVCVHNSYRCAPTLDKIEKCYPSAGWHPICNGHGEPSICKPIICGMNTCQGIDVGSLDCTKEWEEEEMQKRDKGLGVGMGQYFEPNGVTTTESGSSTEYEGGGAGT